MWYVATVHFGTARWIDVQLESLRRHLPEPFAVFAELEQVPVEEHAKFDRSIVARRAPAVRTHCGKLNLLAAEICAVAHSDDVILFMDGDALLVADPRWAVERALRSTSLLAVRRDEHHHDPQPHPCFAAITVGEWQRLHGDWSEGFCWVNDRGDLVTDIGANLLAALQRSGRTWTPLLRTNTRNDHPVFFGVYGGIVYHHGAGFRPPLDETDEDGAPAWLRTGSSGVLDGLPAVGPLLRRRHRRRRDAWFAEVCARNEELSQRWYERLCSDPSFHLALAPAVAEGVG